MTSGSTSPRSRRTRRPSPSDTSSTTPQAYAITWSSWPCGGWETKRPTGKRMWWSFCPNRRP
jgi:hypothetical protein